MPTAVAPVVAAAAGVVVTAAMPPLPGTAARAVTPVLAVPRRPAPPTPTPTAAMAARAAMAPWPWAVRAVTVPLAVPPVPVDLVEPVGTAARPPSRPVPPRLLLGVLPKFGRLR